MPRGQGQSYRLLGGQARLALESFDPNSGKNYTPNPRFAPKVASKLIRAALASGINVAAVLSILVERMEVDADGRPVWASEYMKQEGRPIDPA
jgi:hypothetical protein